MVIIAQSLTREADGLKCHYCGKEVWLVRHLLDGDFCSPVHRKKYHERLRRSLEQLPQVTGPPAPIGGFHFEMPPLDSHGTTGLRSLGFQNGHFHTFPPKYSVGLSPLFGQTFFGPATASAAAPPVACHRIVTMLEPLLPPPDVTPLARSFVLAAGNSVSGSDQWMPIGSAQTDS